MAGGDHFHWNLRPVIFGAEPCPDLVHRVFLEIDSHKKFVSQSSTPNSGSGGAYQKIRDQKKHGNGTVQANVRTNNSGHFEGTAHEMWGFEASPELCPEHYHKISLPCFLHPSEKNPQQKHFPDPLCVDSPFLNLVEPTLIGWSRMSGRRMCPRDS